MTSLTLQIDDETEARLRQIAQELQRDVHDLASCAIAEAALDYFRGGATEQNSVQKLNLGGVQ